MVEMYSPLYQQVKLWTSSAHYVTQGLTINFETPPEVLLWEGRTFVRREGLDDKGFLGYVETWPHTLI